MSHPYEQLKGRYCLFVLVLTWYLPGADHIVQHLKLYEWFWMDLTFIYLNQSITAAFIIAAILIFRPSASTLFGRLPQHSDIWPVVKLVVFLQCITSVLVTAIYIPLSYVLPNFVSWWLTWMYRPIVYLTLDGELSAIANILSLVSLVVLAPILEEILFRGFLLHRLTKKFGLTMGILMSSTVFGAMHPDTLAAAIFGVAMCLLYLHTGSLYVPIFAHSLYNLVVYLSELYGVLSEGFSYYLYTIEQFRNDWDMGIVAAIIAILLFDHQIRKRTAVIPRKLPTG